MVLDTFIRELPYLEFNIGYSVLQLSDFEKGRLDQNLRNLRRSEFSSYGELAIPYHVDNQALMNFYRETKLEKPEMLDAQQYYFDTTGRMQKRDIFELCEEEGRIFVYRFRHVKDSEFNSVFEVFISRFKEKIGGV